MAKFKYFFDLMSPPARGLWIALRFGKTQFEECPVALRKAEQLTDEYKKINRLQKVPALVDGNFHLSESTAMVRYLSDKGQFSEQLYPKTLQERARVDEFLEWTPMNLRLSCGSFFVQTWLLPISGLRPKASAEEIKKHIKEVERTLDLLERLWLDNKFVAGDQLTVADILGAMEIEQIKLCQYNVNEKQFPKVSKWMARVREAANPYYSEAHGFIDKKAAHAAQAKL